MSMPRVRDLTWLGLVGALLAGCLESHGGAGADDTGPVIDDRNCVGCHQADYDGTAAPRHSGQFPTTCADCHGTTSWRPALGGGHPEASFAIADGAHQGVTCQSCHKTELGSSTDGANTDCITCHTRSENDPRHTGVSGYGFQPTVRNFCLQCHPAGTAEGASHPESRFPIASGAHRMTCANCHIAGLGPSTGGQNTSCTGCHTGAHSQTRMTEKHREVNGYAWSTTNQHFCLTCHPRGRD